MTYILYGMRLDGDKVKEFYKPQLELYIKNNNIINIQDVYYLVDINMITYLLKYIQTECSSYLSLYYTEILMKYLIKDLSNLVSEYMCDIPFTLLVNQGSYGSLIIGFTFDKCLRITDDQYDSDDEMNGNKIDDDINKLTIEKYRHDILLLLRKNNILPMAPLRYCIIED